VVPASDKSLEEIVKEVASTDVNQARELADVYVPVKVLLKVIVSVAVIPQAGDCVYTERTII
jgi:hypothetical protein